MNLDPHRGTVQYGDGCWNSSPMGRCREAAGMASKQHGNGGEDESYWN